MYAEHERRDTLTEAPVDAAQLAANAAAMRNPRGLDVLLTDPRLLARVVACIGVKETGKMARLNRRWARETMKPVMWEILAGVPHQPLLSNIFRRASSYCYREMDAPSPNVNRRGSPPVIRACVLNERTSLRDYVYDLRLMAFEDKWFATNPAVFRADEVPELRGDPARLPFVFDNMKVLQNNALNASQDTRILSGSFNDGKPNFYLWGLKSRRLYGSMTHPSASCYHCCNDALAIGGTDGCVRIWDFRGVEARNFGSKMLLNAQPTMTISHRSSMGIMPFLRGRLREKVVNVFMDNSDGSMMHIATSTEKGEANVWDVAKGEIVTTIDASKIHRSSLPRAFREPTPQISSLMLFRNTLVCGTSCGFIRVFDLRSGRLTHRLAGHPDAVVKTDTKGRVLWSAGKEGTIRWWGGKTARVLSKSALCDGEISVLEMDDNVVVAGYSQQGMEAWDVRTQQPLCTFSNAEHGGVRAVQFDSRKLISVSSTGKAALWRWYCPNPVRWFEPPSSSQKIISAQFNDRNLVLGTDAGELLDFDRFATAT